jgi:asparagine synthase (glutamine-hydrolysing)
MYSTRIWGCLGFCQREVPGSCLGSAEADDCFLGFSNAPSERAFNSRDHPHLKIVGDVRLHNQFDPATHSDLQFILSAYAKWGQECPFHLEGEFSFAIWDETRKLLFICRDHVGSRPLFYWHLGDRFIFASDPVVLLRFPGVPRTLNRRKLAALAVANGWEYYPDETLHAGILSLAPAASLAVTRDGLRHQTYWTPGIDPSLVPRRESDAFAMGRELLFSAVRNRIRGSKVVGTALSGGLDSSAVTAIAARCLEQENRELLAFSSVLPGDHPAGLNDEREYIEEFQSWPNIRIEYVTAPGRGPFEQLDRPGEFEAAFGTSSVRYLDAAVADAAAIGGAEILLSGLRGELGPTASGSGHYLDLAVAGRWPTLARQLRDLRRVRGAERHFEPWRRLGGELLDVLQPHRLWRRPLWFHMNPGFERECQAHNPVARGWKNHHQRQLDQTRMFLRRHATRHLTIAPMPVDMIFPLLDRRLLEFCLAAPGSMKVCGGYSRYFVRRALAGLLPEKIQWRTGKIPASPDYFVRFNAQLPKAQEFVARIGPHDPVRSVVDVDRVSGLLRPVDPLSVNSQTTAIPVSLYVICFLRQFAEFRP